MPILLATLYEDEFGVKVEIWGEEINGQVKFTIKLAEDSAPADLNGFFIDLDGDGGETYEADLPQTNMKGTGGFDEAFQIGTPSGNDADVTEATVYWDGSLADLEGAVYGIRAQSVGEDREGSVKIVGGGEGVDPPPGDFFPETDISHIILHLTDGTNDKFIKIDDWTDGSYDLDDCYDVLVAYIAENYPDYELEGIAIWTGAWDGGGNPGYKYFDTSSDNEADTGPTLDNGKTFEELTNPFATGGKKGDGLKLHAEIDYDDFDFGDCFCDPMQEVASLGA